MFFCVFYLPCSFFIFFSDLCNSARLLWRAHWWKRSIHSSPPQLWHADLGRPQAMPNLHHKKFQPWPHGQCPVASHLRTSQDDGASRLLNTLNVLLQYVLFTHDFTQRRKQKLKTTVRSLICQTITLDTLSLLDSTDSTGCAKFLWFNAKEMTSEMSRWSFNPAQSISPPEWYQPRVSLRTNIASQPGDDIYVYYIYIIRM